MSDIKTRLEAVESRFRKGTKQYDAARHIIRKNRIITSEDKKAICQEIPIAKSTLRDLFTELRKIGVYPPQEASDISDHPLTEVPKEVSHSVTEVPPPPSQLYVTREDFETQFETLRSSTNEDVETIKNSINYLAAVISGEPLPNPGEYEKEEDIEVIQPGEMIPSEEVLIQEGSATVERVLLKPKTRMYYDMARQGAFYHYAGTEEKGPFTQFKKGKMSDFLNKIVDDYFVRLFYAEIKLDMWRPVR